MRWMCWIAAMMLLGVFSGMAQGAGADCGCRGAAPMGLPSYAALCGGACCSPTGFALSPGCCEYAKPCCENAWAGYCEHRAKVDAFWSRVGVPKGHRCGGGR